MHSHGVPCNEYNLASNVLLSQNNGIIPVSAATFPTINNAVLFSYGSISMIPLRIVSVTFAPAAYSSKLDTLYLKVMYSTTLATSVTVK